MRISSKPFQREDDSQKIEPRSTYFLVFEGSKTEPIYFRALNRFLSSKIDDMMAKLQIIERNEDEQGLSNPVKIIDLVIGNIENWKENKLMSLPGKQDVCYCEDIDKICLFFDRDKNSFTEEQYCYVLQKCWENDLYPYVTNPNFEFWLLLHFDEVRNLDNVELLENAKINDKTFTERELSKLIGYSKNNYDADSLVPNVSKAVSNEKNYCEDIENLKNCVGSNIGVFVSEFM